MAQTLEERKKVCTEEIEASLKKYELLLDCTMILRVGSVQPMIGLVEVIKEDKIIKP